MKIKVKTPNKRSKQTVLLEQARKQGGDVVIRFHNTTFEGAISDDSEQSFYQILSQENDKSGAIALVLVSGKGPIIYRSPDFPVFVHKAKICIKK